MEEETGTPDVGDVPQMGLEDAVGCGDGEGRKYTRDEMFAIYWGMGDSYYTRVAEVWAELEPVSQELYEMDVDHGAQKPRHKTVDRRQRGKKAKVASSEECSYEEELLLELGLDVPSQSQSSVSESEVYEDDSEEEVESFQPLAFDVQGEPDFESGEPEDGWEYLRRVKWEFKRCPKVVVAKIDSKKFAEQTPYMPSIPPVPTCAPHLLPSKEWETEFLANFSDLRMKYVETIPEEEKEFNGPLPSIHNQVGWETYCFGKSTSPVEEEAVLSVDDNLATTGEVTGEPTLSAEEQPMSVGEITVEGVQTETVQNSDSVLLPNLDSESDFPALGMTATLSDEELDSSDHPASRKLKDAIEESSMLKPPTKNVSKDRVKRKPSDLKGPNAPLLGILMKLDEVKRAALLRYHIAWLERVDGLPEERAQWLFALSVVVDKPLDAQTMAAYRSLLRRCASLRASKTSAEDEDLHRLNVLITIAGRYFGQAEDALS
ncbi:hypothetical protein M758_8G015100 [Ceratodon purpureus]|uniref:Gem-associated protein 2 n=1 Tax=Ceratodon purpureus TaxID=3225 RepID=A0A8T0GU85_CERPU|nr:hypothetical protein KC19_8G015500 [Ceratodon purpureus]KAG0607269.1 hypothetical protein M758_8G015100 [Ceratodon purpureus]